MSPEAECLSSIKTEALKNNPGSWVVLFFLHAGVCCCYGTSRAGNFEPGSKRNAFSMEFSLLTVVTVKWKIAFSTCSACRKTITDLGLWKRICNLCLQKNIRPSANASCLLFFEDLGCTFSLSAPVSNTYSYTLVYVVAMARAGQEISSRAVNTMLFQWSFHYWPWSR